MPHLTYYKIPENDESGLEEESGETDKTRRATLINEFIGSVTGHTEALILARGGSKGVKLKNLQTVGGLSLLARTIRISKSAGLRVTVSTDHPLIALEAKRYGAAVFRRSRITATDWAPSIWGAAEFLASKPEVTTLALIQATSPFIRAESLQEALRKIEHPIAFDCVFAVSRNFKLRWRTLGERMIPVNFKINARPRRQDWSGELLETGAFYFARKHLIENGWFQNDNCTAVEVWQADSLEIDTTWDLRVANALLSYNLV